MHLNLDPNSPPPNWTELDDWLMTLTEIQLRTVLGTIDDAWQMASDELINRRLQQTSTPATAKQFDD